jgi:hypothetical protein
MPRTDEEQGPEVGLCHVLAGAGDRRIEDRVVGRDVGDSCRLDRAGDGVGLGQVPGERLLAQHVDPS